MDYYENNGSWLDQDAEITELNTNCSNEPSEIQKFYRGQTVFITGASGFLGCLVIENLLRCCPEIRKIYILLRQKKGSSVEERFNELLNNEVFDKVKRKIGDLKSKIHVLSGDIGEPMCGLSEPSINTIKEEVNFVVHAAACLRMDEPLRTAYQMNVRATVDLLDLAKQMKHLKAFVHVSTAYAPSTQRIIGEKFYPAGYDEEQIKFLVENLTDDNIAAFTPKLVGPWQNTYVFTKAISEYAVSKYIDSIPVSVVRPAIIIGCEKDPLTGWINNIYGATGVSTAAFVGLMRVWYGDPEQLADLVPADKVVKAIVAAAWHTSVNFEKEKRPLPIYNLVSSNKAPTTWDQYTGLSSKFALNDLVAYSGCVGDYNFRIQPRKWLYVIQLFAMQLIPAMFLDLFLRLKGEKPKLIPAYTKIHKINMLLGYYGLHSWVFEQENVDDMWQNMSLTDRQLFDFDLATLDWESYHRCSVRSIRLYVLKDPVETIPAAQKRFRRFAYMRRAAIMFTFLLLYYNFVHLWILAAIKLVGVSSSI